MESKSPLATYYILNLIYIETIQTNKKDKRKEYTIMQIVMKNYARKLKEKAEEKEHELSSKYGYMYDMLQATPLRKFGNIIRPIKNLYIEHRRYKECELYTVDNATTLITFPDGFSCIYDTADIGFLAEFIDTVDGSINYDNDDENGNINAIHTAWYAGGLVSW